MNCLLPPEEMPNCGHTVTELALTGDPTTGLVAVAILAVIVIGVVFVAAARR